MLSADPVGGTGWDGTELAGATVFEQKLGFNLKEAVAWTDVGNPGTQAGGSGDDCQSDGHLLCAANDPPPSTTEHLGDPNGNQLRPMSHQDPNTFTCVMKTIASSLVYLARKSNQRTVLGHQISFDDLKSHPEGLLALEDDIFRSFQDCDAFNKGVPDEKLANAKAKFVSDNRLAITTHRVPAAGIGGTGALTAALQGLRDGCAVEIATGFYLDGKYLHGHFLALDGATVTPNSASLTLRDPLDGDVKPNIAHSRALRLDFPPGMAPMIKGYRHEYVGPNRTDYAIDLQIEYAVIECPGPATPPAPCDMGLADGSSSSGLSLPDIGSSPFDMSCTLRGQTCASDGDCCSPYLCINNICDCSPDGSRCKATANCCLGGPPLFSQIICRYNRCGLRHVGETCMSAGDCGQSGYALVCPNGVCCSPKFQYCAQASDCCNGFPCGTPVGGTQTVCCIPNKSPVSCSVDNDCCDYRASCSASHECCIPSGAGCSTPSDCCSGICQAGRCP
jgi:hypothetical protein